MYVCNYACMYVLYMYVHVCMYVCCLLEFTTAHSTLILEVLTVLEMMNITDGTETE